MNILEKMTAEEIAGSEEMVRIINSYKDPLDRAGLAAEYAHGKTLLIEDRLCKTFSTGTDTLLDLLIAKGADFDRQKAVDYLINEMRR